MTKKSEEPNDSDLVEDLNRSSLVCAIIVAAGRGHRFGSELPKQYVPLAGACSLQRSVSAFLNVGHIGLICVVIHPDDADLCCGALSSLDDRRLLAPVAGGSTRANSVRMGLESLVKYAPDLVLIHDAARPFVSTQVIENVIGALKDADGACAALPIVDAIWNTADGCAQTPVPRDGLWRAQTPQGFHFNRILAAHRASDGNASDDVAVAREHGLSVRLVQGSDENYKITHSADLQRALKDAGASQVAVTYWTHTRAAG